jgi:hypothetical protein
MVYQLYEGFSCYTRASPVFLSLIKNIERQDFEDQFKNEFKNAKKPEN